MNFWKKKPKCPLCDSTKELSATIRINTADGPVELDICDFCADFFNESAEIFRTRRKKENSEEDII